MEPPPRIEPEWTKCKNCTKSTEDHGPREARSARSAQCTRAFALRRRCSTDELQGHAGSAPRIRTWISSVNSRAHCRCARAKCRRRRTFLRLRAFQDGARAASCCTRPAVDCQRPRSRWRLGWLGDQDSNLDWRLQRPQSLPLDDLPKLEVGLQGIATEAKRRCPSAPEARDGYTLPFRLRAECSALELETQRARTESSWSGRSAACCTDSTEAYDPSGARERARRAVNRHQSG